jgi:hypothetical protein
MGGVGSGSWYRLDKKTTTDKCKSIDVRYLHRNGLLRSRLLVLLTVVAGWEAD